MLPGRQVRGHQRGEPGLVDEVPEEPVEGAGVPGDDRGHYDTARAGDPSGLGQGAYPVRALGQVASGTIDVAEEYVTLQVFLPWLLAKVAAAIQPLVRKEGTLLLEKK